MKKRDLARLLIGAAAVTVGATTFATAAQAVYTCAGGQVCIFKDADFKGTVAVEPAFQAPGILQDFRQNHYTNTTILNDSASSVVNNSNLHLTLYQNIFGDSHGLGETVDIPPHTRMNLTWVIVHHPDYSNYESFNDMASAGETSVNSGV